MELNSYLTLFPGSIVSMEMATEELIEILLHAIPNVWGKQAYLQGWDFKGGSYKDTCNMFERMDIADQVYEGGTPYKNNHRVEANRAIHERKHKLGRAAFPTNLEKGRTRKRKRKDAGHGSDGLTGSKTCLLHGPEHSLEEFKFLKEYSKKHAVNQPFKDKES